MSDSKVLDYTNTKLPPPWAILLMKPIGRFIVGLSVICFLGLLWSARLPSWSGFSMWVFACIPLALWLVVRGLVCMILHGIYRTWRIDAKWSRVFIPLAIALCAVILIACDVPGWIAWHISKPAIQRLVASTTTRAASLPGDAAIDYPGCWAGMYQFKSITYLPQNQGVLLVIDEDGFFGEQIGFAYSPGHPPPSTRKAGLTPDTIPWNYRSVGNDWYSMYWSGS